MSEPLYLVDGSGYIFRAYYAVQPLSSDDGLPTNALFGFSRMLIKLLKDVEARHIAVMFDTKAPTFRHERFSEYKANRSACPEDLVPQMPYFRDIVKAFGIQCYEKEGFEADDIIATLALRFVDSVDRVVIVSGDKDLTQLVNDKIEVWDAMREIHYDPSAVEAKFGVKPEQIVDYLALMGDASDNIPGVKGIGGKTAQALINHFGSAEAMLAAPEKIEEIEGLRGKAGVRKKVELGAEGLRLSKELITLDTGVEPYSRIESVEEFLWTEPQAEMLEPLFEKLSFHKMLQEVPTPSGNGVGSNTALAQKAARQSIIVAPNTFDDFLKKIKAVERFAFDTETTSLDVIDCELVGISISWEAGVAYYLPLQSEVETERLLDADKVREALNPIFSNPKILKGGLNLKYDIGVLEEHGYTVRGLGFDGMLASYVLNPDKRQHGLKALALKHLNEEMMSFEDMLGEHEHIGLVPIDVVGKYAAHDADASWQLWELLEKKIADASDDGGSLQKVFQEVEMPLIPVLSHIERSGVKIDTAYLAALSEEFHAEMKTLEAAVHKEAGREFNLNSPKQLSEILFVEMAIPTTGVKKTKTGFSTDASVLQKLAAKYPFVEKLLSYRELAKLTGTYVDALAKIANPETSRIHASFNQAIAATGRLSSSNPNLQNIPIRSAQGRRIRDAFIADEGHCFVSADYSQIELRVLAHLADDANLQRAFHEGEDIHAATARDIFGGNLMSDEELKDLRRVAKTINFGIIYGMSAFRLAGDLGVSRKQAQQYIDDYFARYPNVRRYFDSIARDAETLGYVETLFGRRRYLADIETSGRDAGYVKRSLMNAPVQGSAAEVIKVAMIKLYDKIQAYDGAVRMVLQVHDELVFEVPDALADEVEKLVVSEMEAAVELAVPLKVDTRVGKRWGEGK